ncbi:hypothetical protein L6164_023600 [Bauhinia variegata]|uniref:Uncharacterized protein n=1 Tax=Bauhinia variegata TaxID=167791 RepID=A0ACB9MKA4_BAUVA|nr:hypothetical protein L6164_023600 [Bauhinia variegata]
MLNIRKLVERTSCGVEKLKRKKKNASSTSTHTITDGTSPPSKRPRANALSHSVPPELITLDGSLDLLPEIRVGLSTTEVGSAKPNGSVELPDLKIGDMPTPTSISLRSAQSLELPQGRRVLGETSLSNRAANSPLEVDGLQAAKDTAEDNFALAEKVITLEAELKTIRDKVNATEEKIKTAKDRANVAEKKTKVTEDKVNVAKENAKIAEDRASTAGRAERDQLYASQARVIKRTEEKLVGTFVGAAKEGFDNCLHQVSLYPRAPSLAELIKFTNFMKVVRDGVIVDPNDKDELDLSLKLSDLDVGSAGKDEPGH